jgi:hypothetical protein
MPSLPKQKTDKNLEYTRNRLLSDIKNALCELLEKPEEESLDPILYCNDDCIVTGATAFIRDEETGEVITQYFDASLAPSGVAPSGSPCGPKCALDYEIVENCYEDPATCEKYKQLITFTFKGGMKEETSVCWILPDGSISTTEPTGIRPCTDDCNCDPQVESFQGNAATLTTFNEIDLFVPKCCEITVTTSAGTFTIPSQPSPFNFCKKFDCLVSGYSIAGDCISDVYTLLTKTK